MTTKFLCRLCLEEANHLLEVFGQIGEIIARHFWFEIKQDDSISNKVCTVCWSKIEEFHEFYTKIEKAQNNIAVVIENKFTILDEKNEIKSVIIANSNNGEIIEQQVDFCNYKIETQFSQEHFAVDQSDIESTSQKSLSNENNDDEMNVEQLKHDNNLNEGIECEDENENENLSNENKLKIIRTSVRRVKNERLSCLRRPRSSSKEKENDESKCSGFDGYSSGGSDEYIPTDTKTRKGARSSIKKQRFIAQKDQEDTIIESYYNMKCDLCHKDMEKVDALFDHYSNIHSIRGFITCCGKKIFRKTVIAEHVIWHTDPEKFKCTICNKIYADKRCLNNHLLAHAPPDMKLFKCDHCPKSFVKKFKLTQHQLCHLTPEEKKYICDECEKPYASDALLRAHKRVVHEKTYAHMCEICAKVFKSRVFFEKHQLEHLGQNLPRVQCQICKAWMKNEHTMRAHSRLHQDEGLIHQCDICGKQGPSRNAILKHKRFVHLSERKFKCTLCDKAFKRAITLKEHMTVHTGEVLYSCTFCTKTFNSGANMHAHRKKSHPVEWEEEKRNKMLSIKPEMSS